MSPQLNPIRPLTARPQPPRASLPQTAPSSAATSTAAYTPAPYPGYPTYPAYPVPQGPSLGHGLTLIFQGLGEVLVVTARAALVVLQWAGTAAVAVLGFAWEVIATVGRALGRGLRAIFDPGYPPQPGYPSYPGYPTPPYPGYPVPRR